MSCKPMICCISKMRTLMPPDTFVVAIPSLNDFVVNKLTKGIAVQVVDLYLFLLLRITRHINAMAWERRVLLKNTKHKIRVAEYYGG